MAVPIGGKIDLHYGEQTLVTGHVVAITDGAFKIIGPMTAGMPVDMGPAVVLWVRGIDIVISSERFQAYDTNYLKHANIDLRKKDVVSVKSAHHFRAAYAPFASEIIVVDGGRGLTSRNYKELNYTKVREPVSPLHLD